MISFRINLSYTVKLSNTKGAFDLLKNKGLNMIKIVVSCLIYKNKKGQHKINNQGHDKLPLFYPPVYLGTTFCNLVHLSISSINKLVHQRDNSPISAGPSSNGHYT